jgi:type IV secretory pathway TrbD component
MTTPEITFSIFVVKKYFLTSFGYAIWILSRRLLFPPGRASF